MLILRLWRALGQSEIRQRLYQKRNRSAANQIVTTVASYGVGRIAEPESLRYLSAWKAGLQSEPLAALEYKEVSMAIFKWDDSYSVSVKLLDDQHKQLLALLNELNEGYNQGRAQEVLRRTLSELSTYAMTHFAAEEALMIRTQFPDYEQHHREHHDLTEQLKAFVTKYEDHSLNIEVDLLLFLRDWLVHHIAETDKLYSAHLNSCGID